MYLDINGNVTVGIGHLLSNVQAAQALAFDRTQHLSRGHGDSEDIERAASSSEIASAFNAIKANPKAPTNVHLSDGAVIDQCVKDVKTTETGLRGLYAGYDNFPNHAKTALVDMGFNMGIGKLKSEFPNFNAAVNRSDWNGAANESHRTGISQDRNNDTAAQLREAVNGH
jgi:GH24 family phage-related lysozyme (muramidase)